MATKVKLIADNVITTDQIDLTSIDTDNLSEGSTNLYFTNARVDSRLSGGTGVTYSSGEISIGQAVATDSNVTFADLTVTGDLNITGDINSYNVTDLDVTDQTITLGAGQTEALSGGSGIIIDGSSASLLWNESDDRFDFNKSVGVAGTLRAVGVDSTNSNYAGIFRNSGGQNIMLMRNDGAVLMQQSYLFVNNSDGIYSDGSIKARGGIVNDQGDLSLNDNVNVSGNLDVTGTVTADGLTLDGANGKIYLPQTPNTFNWIGDSIEQTGIFIDPTNDNASEEIRLVTNNAKRLSINYLGDISFYEDTGTTAKLFWDASAESLGIGTGSDTLNSKLVVKGGINNIFTYSTTTTDQPGLFAGNNSAFNTSTNTLYAKIYGSGISSIGFGVTLGDYAVVASDGTDNNGLLIGSFNNTPIIFGTNNTERMSIDSSGALGLGTTPPTTNIHPQFFIGTEAFILGSTGGALDLGNNLYYNSGWKHRTTGAASLLNFDSSGNLVFYNVASASADSAATLDEALRITSDGKLGIGTGTSPASGLHVKSATSSTGNIIATLESTDSGNSWMKLKGNSTNSFQLGSTSGGIEFYDDASSTYVAKINNNTNDHNLQKWCYAEFDAYDNGSADAWEEKANLAANVYSLYGANINPGKYGNNLYYVGVGRENVSEAYVEFKVDLVEARSIYAYFGVSNSADGSTRYARLWYSYDGEVYTQVDNNSFGAGGTSASYTLNLTSVLHHGDGDFTGSVYFRCGLMDNASQHTTLIGWTDFKFKAFAESMTFDGRYKRGSSSTSLVDNSGGGQETNFVPKVPYVHTFTLTSAGASSIVTNNGGNGQFTSAGHSYLNKEIFQIVSSPTYGIQCLTEGTIFYTVHQDIITTGSSSYARVYVQRVNSTASSSINVGMHLITNTNGEWDSISGQGSFDVVAGDIIRFNYSATGINSMDAGSWSYYTLMYLPHTTSTKGNAQGNSNFPFAGGI